MRRVLGELLPLAGTLVLLAAMFSLLLQGGGAP